MSKSRFGSGLETEHAPPWTLTVVDTRPSSANECVRMIADQKVLSKSTYAYVHISLIGRPETAISFLRAATPVMRTLRAPSSPGGKSSKT